MGAVFRAARAELDLIDIWRYIARDDPAAADRQLDRVEEACLLLAGNPRLGPNREDLASGLRFYPVDSYLIFYIPDSDGITVARVIHGKRDYRREFR